MSIATLELVSPTGVPVTLTVTKDDETADIIATLERADKIGAWCKGKGWGFATQPAAGPSAMGAAPTYPTFYGYRCSHGHTDGIPTWIMAEDANGVMVQADLHSKQMDRWYSYKVRGDDGTEAYVRVLTIRKGETAPPIIYPAGQGVE